MSEFFDFGFTAVDEHELTVVQEAEKAVQEAGTYEDKLNRLYNAVLPLLSNLKANPEKDYIYWPNRVEKVDQFEDMINGIMKD